MEEEKVVVIFKRYRSGNKEVLAIFPTLSAYRGRVVIYQHVGQHGEGDVNFVSSLKPASLDEPDVKDLYDELTSIGYNLVVKHKISQEMLKQAWSRTNPLTAIGTAMVGNLAASAVKHIGLKNPGGLRKNKLPKAIAGSNINIFTGYIGRKSSYLGIDNTIPGDIGHVFGSRIKPTKKSHGDKFNRVVGPFKNMNDLNKYANSMGIQLSNAPYEEHIRRYETAKRGMSMYSKDSSMIPYLEGKMAAHKESLPPATQRRISKEEQQTNPSSRWYYGYSVQHPGAWILFTSASTPTERSHGKLVKFATGPYETKAQAWNNLVRHGTRQDAMHVKAYVLSRGKLVPFQARLGNPGAEWHRKERAWAEKQAQLYKEDGMPLQASRYKGMAAAHGVSERVSKAQHMNPKNKMVWHMYAGGISAPEGKHSYKAVTDVGEFYIDPITTQIGRFIAYEVKFANTKGAITGGLWHWGKRFNHPNAAKHFAQFWYESILKGPLTDYYLSHTKSNPAKKGMVKIYDEVESIHAIKGADSLWPNQRFKHDFKSRSKAEVFGLPDGSLMIKSKTGKPLHKMFNYPEKKRKLA